MWIARIFETTSIFDIVQGIYAVKLEFPFTMILMTGGTGFIGREIARRLRDSSADFCLLVRPPGTPPSPERENFLKDELRVTGDVLDAESLNRAVQGCETVIHLVGIIAESGRDTFQKMHVEAVRNVVAAARRGGVKRILHMSALGARQNARSRYHQTKWEGEEIVRGSGIPYVIFRPSVVAGKDDHFINFLAGLIKKTRWFFPVFGAGTNKLQPVWVEDVAACLAKAALNPDLKNREYVLTGPLEITYDVLIDFIMNELGLHRTKVHIPWSLAKAAAAVMEKLPKPLVTRDQLLMLQEDNTGDNAAMKRDFGIDPRPLEKILRGYLC